jgi:phenylacetic acid degradation operon negative regulatory protein
MHNEETGLSAPLNPRSGVFALFGQYILPRGGEIWLGAMIRAMAAWGISEAAVRSTTLRMKKEGYLQSRRQGRRISYWLTGKGLDRLNMGGFRFSIPPDEEWNGQWTIVVYSVPEKERGYRDELRNALHLWKFGMLAPGTWLSTRPLLPEFERELRESGVWKYVDVFRSEYLADTLDTLVAKAFPQLPTLADHFRDYIIHSEPLLHRYQTGQLDDEACFVTRLQNLWAFGSIAGDDPILPPSLLPEDWPRPQAQLLCGELQQVLTGPAERFFGSIYETK